jgi:hypothetical protein
VPDETATLLVVAEAQVMVPRCPEQPSFADGEMPPFYDVYPMHMGARLSAADQQAFKEWITSESANLGFFAYRPEKVQSIILG